VWVGVEMGVPGLSTLLCSCGVSLSRLWPLTREWRTVLAPLYRRLAHTVIASQVGFMLVAQFVTLHMLEIPYFLVSIGAEMRRTFDVQERARWVLSPTLENPSITRHYHHAETHA
jgi:hypothetical protein